MRACSREDDDDDEDDEEPAGISPARHGGPVVARRRGAGSRRPADDAPLHRAAKVHCQDVGAVAMVVRSLLWLAESWRTSG